MDKALDALRHGKEKILVAGSTWPKDQALLAPSIDHLMSRGWKLIIVPHEVDEVSIDQCCRQFWKGSSLV